MALASCGCRGAHLRTCNASQRCWLSTTACVSSGHNRWSKIRHEKGSNDMARQRVWSAFSGEITTATKMWGPDPNANPRLALALTKAKKAGFPKTNIEAAMARGQGIGPSSYAEVVTVEAMLPAGVACIVEFRTERKAATLQAVRTMVKAISGRESATKFLFSRRGRIVLGRKGKGGGEEEDMDPDEAGMVALDAGAVDVAEEETDDGKKLVVYSEHTDTKAVADRCAEELGVGIEECDIVWVPNEETIVELRDAEAAGKILEFIEKMLNEDLSVVKGCGRG
ncbi:transcriptional regulator TACO1-like protein [Lineolata rhizophorae]|uniref:Transcriptional regulator TACO1-like protein n=1 Tax=Lineolata rhizophorae TaxID=578093 RepID=A0A6A6NSV5_9PEZI|nr:transcriptional regulator TACO1-like protein [Lineolata rhizophorae]